MKIAYIFFGQVKNFERHQFDTFRENVQSKICDHDIDYHLVTSKRSKYGTPRQQQSEGTENAINHHTIKKYFDFKNIFYDELDSIDCSEIESLAENLVSNFGGAWGEDSLQATINSLKQIYSLEFFHNQFSKLGEDYDAYILSRSDLFHTHPIDADCLSRDGDIFIPYYDALPQIDCGWFGGVNDRFAIIKNQSTLKTYCTRYSSIKNNPQFYHAEKYLKQKLESAKTDIQKIHNFEFKFLRGNGKITDQIGIYPDANMNTNLNKISKSFFINLDRRTDRLNHINDNLPFFANRFSAVDGNSAKLDEEVKTLFPKTWQKRTKAEICCAISHYRLWKQLVFDNDAHNYLILEDDVVFKPGTEKFWNDVFSHKMPSDFSIIYLGGCQPWNRPHYHKVLQKHNEYFCTVKKNDYFTTGDHFWHMNASSYIISRQAAMLICQWVEQQGMDEALDNFMQNFFNKNKLFTANNSIYHLDPLIAYQLHEEGDNFEADKNSDIRHSKEKFADNVSAEIKIPRRIFQTWETCDLGPVFNKLSNQVKAMNSGYEYHLFDAEQRRLFIEKNFTKDVLDCYDRIIPGAFKADLWRCCVSYKLGGIYCDIDMLAANSFDSLIEGDIDFFAPIDFPRNQRGNILYNAVFGCAPGCEIVKNCIDIIVDHVQNETWHKNQTEDIIYDYLNFAGPAVLGRAVNRFLDRDENTSFGKNYGIIEHKNKRIKLIEFSDRDEYIKDAHGKVIVQNKNGNEKLKRMIDEEMPSYGLRHWGEQLGLDRKPYISDAVKINPTAVRHHGIEYVLYRTESYPQNCPAYYRASSGKKINFYRSNAGYQLKIGESKTIDCTFDFGDYSYVKSKMIDLAGTSRMKIEDVRFVENTIESNNGELSCLACCTILSDIDVFEGQKKEDGYWNEKKPIGLKLKTSPGVCRVNLNTGEIQYIRTLTNQSDDIQKNWLMFKHDDLYYCLYSMFPLLYCAKESIEQIEFSQQEKRVVPKMHNATCPIKIDDNSYAMICHSERQHVEQKPGSLPWAYKKYFVSFDLENGEITNIYSQELDNIKPEYYCSSILKDGDRLKVFAGVEDVDCVEFSVDIPRSKKSKPTHKLIFTQKNLFEQDFLLELFDDVEIVYDVEMTGVYENACIVYSDIYHRDSNVYKNEEFRKTLNQQKQKLFNFLNQQKNCCLVHLSDEHRHANIDHYKNFKHVFRQYYRSDAAANNVTFIPLGYKSGFHDQ